FYGQLNWQTPYAISDGLTRSTDILRRKRGEILAARAKAMAEGLGGSPVETDVVEEPIRHIMFDARHIWGHDTADAAIQSHGEIGYAHALAEGLRSEGFTGRITLLVNDPRAMTPQTFLFGEKRALEGTYQDPDPVDLWIAPVGDFFAQEQGSHMPLRIRTNALTTRVHMPLVHHEDENLLSRRDGISEKHVADGYLNAGGQEVSLQPFSRFIVRQTFYGDDLMRLSREAAREVLAAAVTARRAIANNQLLESALRAPFEATQLLKLYPPEPAKPVTKAAPPPPAPIQPPTIQSSGRLWDWVFRLLS
ncbi:MAG: hypothetical protein HYZ74_06270, partial [Elusimicrobia bacterium]|nr:hypothetical protein [Elusimicrobiota bacterium]